MNEETIQRIHSTYGIENWSAGYFDVNNDGNIIARPSALDPRSVDLKNLVDHLVKDKKVQLPILLRFPQILTNQLRILSSAYRDAIGQFGYLGKHYPVSPMKVNPRREVVEEFLKESDRCRVGLECGSKAEVVRCGCARTNARLALDLQWLQRRSILSVGIAGCSVGQASCDRCREVERTKNAVASCQRNGRLSVGSVYEPNYTRGSGKWASSGGDSAQVSD